MGAELRLRNFLSNRYSQLPEESGQILLLYIAFVQSFCYQYHIPYESCEQLEGLLPRLFRQVAGYEIKDAAVTLDAAIPWEFLHKNPQLSDDLDRLCRRLSQKLSATPAWLQAQVDDLFELENTFFGTSVTPSSVRELIARLAVQQHISKIIDLCSGTYSLGLQVWKEAGSNPFISCQGEEMNNYLCAISRLLLFLSGVRDFSIKQRNVMEPPFKELNQQLSSPILYVADFPLAGNRTFPITEKTPFFAGQKTNLYADWLLIHSVLSRMQAGDRAFLIVTKGALVRQNEQFLRKYLVEQDWLDAVIKLPAGLYPDHNLPLNLLICEKGRNPKKQGQIFFADLSSFAKPSTRRMKRLSSEGISKLCNNFLHFTNENNFSKVVSAQDIENAAYSLYPPPYLVTSPILTNQVRLGDIAIITRGLQLPKRYDEALQTSRYLLNIRDLQNGEICYENAEQIGAGGENWEYKYRIQEDDIILTSKGSALKIAIIPPNPPPAYISGNLTLIRVNCNLYDPYILYEYLISDEGQLALGLIQTGTTIRVLGSHNLEQLQVPSYDRRLAAKIGALLKDAALKYRQHFICVNEAYARQKKDLLFQLKQGKGTEK